MIDEYGSLHGMIIGRETPNFSENNVNLSTTDPT
jgi:hypothetical protein